MRLGLVVAVALLAAVPAAANDMDFRTCDGFKSPTATTDGTETSWGGPIGLTSQPTDEAAVASCDTALADPLLKPEFELRRFLLLRGKAVHQLALKRGAAANATLDQADAVLARLEGPLARSLVTSNGLLHAYADYLRGEAEAARARLAGIEKANRYSVQVTQTALAMRMTLDPDPAEIRRAMLARVPADPALINQLFWLAFYYSDFAEAVRLGPQVSFDLPRGRGDSRISGLKDRQYDLISMRAEYAGAMAYALAATGQEEAARGAMAKARQDLAEAVRVPATPPRTPRERTDRDLRIDAGQTGTAKLDLWARAIEARAKAPTMTSDEFLAAVAVEGMRDLPIGIDLLNRFKPKSPGEQASVDRTIKELRRRNDKELRELEPLDLAEMVNSLARPGAIRPNARLRAAGDGFLFDDANGFYVKQERRSPYLNIRYGDTSAPKWTIEELTLLAAATYARKAGKDSFLIDSRMMVDRTLVVISYGRSGNPMSNGAELRYRILPVNAGELTPELESRRWRLIAVQDVIDELGPIYQPPVAKTR